MTLDVDVCQYALKKIIGEWMELLKVIIEGAEPDHGNPGPSSNLVSHGASVVDIGQCWRLRLSAAENHHV